MAHQQKILLESGTNELEVIEFSLSYPNPRGAMIQQSFGINVAKVREIIRMPEITQLPNMPASIRGVFNLRDNIVPVLDLAHWLFGFENGGEDRKMIVTEFNNLRFGFVVNDVYRIHRFSWKQVEAPDAIQSFNPENSSIIGIIKTDGKNILMVDVEKIMADINPSLGMDIVTGNEKKIGDGFTALIAEDSPTIRKIIVERMRLAGFKIINENDGQAAWDALQIISHRAEEGEKLSDMLNIVITDIEMPRMDGHTLTKNIKTHPILSKLPVIIFSSIVSEDVLHRGQSVGADAQLTKPQISLLLETVAKLLDKYAKK